MATKRSTNPQIVSPYSPLEQLALVALKRFGEMGTSTVEAEAMVLFLSYANSIIDEIHAHPYWQKGVTIPYYTHWTESRKIPDTIMVVGLLARWALDQDSKKAPRLMGEYYSKLNSVLSTEKFGVGAEFSIQAVDVEGGGVS